MLDLYLDSSFLTEPEFIPKISLMLYTVLHHQIETIKCHQTSPVKSKLSDQFSISYIESTKT